MPRRIGAWPYHLLIQTQRQPIRHSSFAIDPFTQIIAAKVLAKKWGYIPSAKQRERLPRYAI